MPGLWLPQGGLRCAGARAGQHGLNTALAAAPELVFALEIRGPRESRGEPVKVQELGHLALRAYVKGF